MDYEKCSILKDVNSHYSGSSNCYPRKGLVSITQTFTAGALLRKSVKREIEKFCAINDIECSLQEFKYFTESEFLMKLKGEDYKVNSLLKWLKELGDAQ